MRDSEKKFWKTAEYENCRKKETGFGNAVKFSEKQNRNRRDGIAV